MLTQIDVECDQPFYLPVGAAAKPRDSLIIEKVTGLGPPDKTLFVGDYARDGGLYTGRRVAVRNPVFDIKINPNYSIGDTFDQLREVLHRAFNDPFVIGDDVSIVLHDDVKVDRMFTGYCETFNDEIFSENSVVQISMICPDPYIRAVSPTVLAPVAPNTGWQSLPFTYPGTAETGFEVTIKINSTTSSLTLDNNGRTMVLTYATFQANDIVYINTKPGSRQIKLTRSGVDYDILYALYSASPWLALHSQTNTLKVYGTSPSNIIAAMTNLTYTPLWWGV